MIKYRNSTSFIYGLLLALALGAFCFTSDAYCQNDQIAMMLQTAPPKGGTITPGPGVHSFSVNSEVALTAVPKPGYQFIYWMGDVSDPTSINTTAYLDSPKIIIAVFERSEFEFEFHVVERASSTPVGGMRASAADYSRGGYSGGGAKRPHKRRFPSFDFEPPQEPPEPPEPQPDDFPVPDEDDNQAFPVPQPTPEPATGLLLITGAFFAVRFRSKKAVTNTTIKLIIIFAIFLCLFTTASLRAEAPSVILETNHGNIIIELFHDDAPVTVDNFLTYVRDGFYDGLIFHRVMSGFMIQGGGYDPNLDLRPTGDPIINESNNGLSNLLGTVAMARLGGDSNSATSEFFINHNNNDFLDYGNTQDGYGHAVFGKVISDMNVIDLIAVEPNGFENGMENVPLNDVIIYSASIFSDFDGDHIVNFTDYTILANQWMDDSDSTKIADPEPATLNEFGYSVSIGGRYGLAGSPGDVPNGNSAGHVTLMKRDGSNIFSFTADDTASGDWLGFAVSMSDDIALVSALGDNSERGAAYMFECTDTDCTQVTKYTAPDGQPGDWFGYSVSIDAFYAVAIIGAVGDDELGSNAGAVYIAIEEPVKITAADGAAGDRFGYSANINGDYAIVGAIGDDDNGSDSGSAYILKDSGGSWLQQAKLTASDGAADDRFGYSVSINGEYAAVGAIYDDDKGSKSGSVYIFKRDGENWTQQVKLTAFDGAALDRFGYSVSFDSYNDFCVISAVRDDDAATDTGSIYLYERNGSTWVYKNKFTAPDANDNDYLGHSVSMTNGRIIAGAIGDNDNGSKSGSVYLFGLGLCPTADLNDDCVVDYHDLRILADKWLTE